jgi:hypothetical protein
LRRLRWRPHAIERGVEPKLFRVRVKAKSDRWTRLLALAAESIGEARTPAERVLDSAWTIMEVRVAWRSADELR